MANQRILNVGTPVGVADAATKAYVDTAVAGVSGGGGDPSFIVSADGTQKILAANTSAQFQSGGLTHTSISSGSYQIGAGSLDIASTSSSATANQLTFRSTGVVGQTGLKIVNFTDGSDQKTRIACTRTGNPDVYLDLSTSNQQL